VPSTPISSTLTPELVCVGAPGAVLPKPARRASKSDYQDEDVELWTPGALGVRDKTDKRLRRVVRDAQQLADRTTGGAPSPESEASAPEQ
jgi:tRNA (adenine57-N1/adenine58-N1)-methyltransferase